MDKGGNTICFPMDLQLLALGPPTKKKKKAQLSSRPLISPLLTERWFMLCKAVCIC